MTVHLVLAIDPDQELFDVVGVTASEQGAIELANKTGVETGYLFTRWAEVEPTPDQSFTYGFESHPQNGLYFRIERHGVRP